MMISDDNYKNSLYFMCSLQHLQGAFTDQTELENT